MTTERDDDLIDAAFAAARRAEPVPSEAFVARVLADAETARGAPAPPPRRSVGAILRLALDAVGGWTGATGLAAAALAGVWIGAALPVDLPGLTDTVSDAAAYDLADLSVDFSFAEAGE